MLLILLKSSACLAVFMLFYKLCLEKTSAHTFKRFYLIAVILISISIPFIVFTEYIETKPANLTNITEFKTGTTDVLENKLVINYTSIILWSIYILGVIIFSFRFFKNLYQIFQKIKANPKYKNQNYINVLLHDLIHPHTFFNYIFLNKNNYEHNLIPKEVLLHEQVHAKQKHAIDILFIEVLQIAFWFNPLLYFIKKDIKLNHEFLADQAVINKGINTKQYQYLLLAFSSNAADIPLANAINYSLIKKRFTVMKTKTSKTVIWFRSLVLLPLLAILIYSFSNKNYIEYDYSLNETITQEKATKKQVEEYNALAKKYNAQPQNKRVIKLKDVNRLEYLYSLMSEEQKVNSQPFPDCPPPPAPPIVKKGDASNIPPPPKPPYAKKCDVSEVPNPPLPPAPKPPLDHVIDMAKKGAIFYYNGKKVSSDEAIELLKKNKNLNISSKTIDDVSVVKIQTEPIRL
ncbi:M56 family metallopeptidase [uncultured Algibacter sp.]|uniref:M56 family metallopeptidase n=1 Tax=uncultured Algibacter sp. TaxID=298659 RepID=UPI00261A8226|nr:M56 family metallopeptidase [uncultured Algibacter sp.]